MDGALTFIHICDDTCTTSGTATLHTQLHTYLSLYHKASISPHSPNKPKDINSILGLYLLQLAVKSDECARPSNTSTAVHHHWPSILRIRVHDFANKSQEWRRILGHTMIRPGSEVKLSNNPLFFGVVSLETKCTNSIFR